MKRVVTLLLIALVLPGCSSPEAPAPSHYVEAVIATADFTPPIDIEKVNATARELGWRNLTANIIADGFSLVFLTDEGEEVRVVSHVSRPTWTFTRIYPVGRDAGRYATSQEAVAASDALWPTLEPRFLVLVEEWEAAGGWTRERVRHACYCAEA
ncbi:MAG TPA: hypothetical protein VFH78_14820 [Candidatus Thermoplasmatota archaeon]|nr:hypothetical protein [Candidatus Thermoplasmatota archaeon]